MNSKFEEKRLVFCALFSENKIGNPLSDVRRKKKTTTGYFRQKKSQQFIIPYTSQQQRAHPPLQLFGFENEDLVTRQQRTDSQFLPPFFAIQKAYGLSSLPIPTILLRPNGVRTLWYFTITCCARVYFVCPFSCPVFHGPSSNKDG